MKVQQRRRATAQSLSRALVVRFGAFLFFSDAVQVRRDPTPPPRHPPPSPLFSPSPNANARLIRTRGGRFRGGRGSLDVPAAAPRASARRRVWLFVNSDSVGEGCRARMRGPPSAVLSGSTVVLHAVLSAVLLVLPLRHLHDGRRRRDGAPFICFSRRVRPWLMERVDGGRIPPLPRSQTFLLSLHPLPLDLLRAPRFADGTRGALRIERGPADWWAAENAHASMRAT